jgi:predicted dehydrogenase
MSNTSTPKPTIGVAIIGAGERGIYFIGSRMAEMAEETGLRIVGLHDRLADRMRFGCEHLNKIYAKNNVDCEVDAFADMAELIHHPDVDLVLVTTHTNAHREPTIMALEAGKKTYLDKPISVTLEDAEAIQEAELRCASPVLMGFTRRYEASWRAAVQHVEEGAIGDLQMVLLRSVIPYTRYMQLWHRDQSLSGGAINDKCSHHFDVLNWLAKSEVQSLTAVGGRSSIFKPDPTAPKRCSECDRTCAYRRHDTLIDQEEGSAVVPNPSWLEAEDVRDRNDNCVYLPGAEIDDHAIVAVAYENGVKANLFFTLFGPWAKDQETLELVGSTGRLRLERSSGTIDLVTDHGKKHRVYKVENPDKGSTHYGADRQLVKSLRAFADGEAPTVGVREGVRSLRMVLATQNSISQQGRVMSKAEMEVSYA